MLVQFSGPTATGVCSAGLVSIIVKGHYETGSVQARATKLIPYIRHMRYEYWIVELDLFSLGNR